MVPLQFRVPERQLHAERHRLGVDAVRPADHRRAAVLLGTLPHRVEQPGKALHDQVAGLPHLQRLRGIEHVGRGQAEVQPSRRRADVLGHRGRERDDVVLGDLFDLLDARDVEAGALAQLTRRLRGNHAGFGHRIGGRELDVEPGLVAPLVTPDGAHFGVRVTGNHRRGPDAINSSPDGRAAAPARQVRRR